MTEKTSEQQPEMPFICEGFQTFTPAQANEILQWCRYERQRDEGRAKAHISALAEQMRRGLWLSKTQIDFARVGHRLVLVNGHHRMRAQVAANSEIIWSIAIHDCSDETELAQLYWKFDTTLRKRSNSNVINGIGLAERFELSKNMATAFWSAAPIVVNGLKFYKNMNAGHNMLPEDRIAACEMLCWEAGLAQEFIRHAPPFLRSKLLSASRLSVMLATLHHQENDACDFWLELCRDDGLKKGDPRKTLVVDMQSRVGSKGLQVAHMMACARAWNAFYEGKDLSIIKVTGSSIPLRGTPYTIAR